MKIIFILAMLLASSQAHAWPFGIPGMPRCGYHESFDSYGRGLKASFTGEDERPYQLGDKLDEQCYGLGYEKGATVLADARAADLALAR